MVGSVALGLLPFVPVVPGVGSVVVLAYGWAAGRRDGIACWSTAGALVVGVLGLALAAAQLLSAVASVLGAFR